MKIFHTLTLLVNLVFALKLDQMSELLTKIDDSDYFIIKATYGYIDITTIEGDIDLKSKTQSLFESGVRVFTVDMFLKRSSFQSSSEEASSDNGSTSLLQTGVDS